MHATSSDCAIIITGSKIGRSNHNSFVLIIESHPITTHASIPPEKMFPKSLALSDIIFANTHTISSIPTKRERAMSAIFPPIVCSSAPIMFFPPIGR